MKKCITFEILLIFTIKGGALFEKFISKCLKFDVILKVDLNKIISGIMHSLHKIGEAS